MSAVQNEMNDFLVRLAAVLEVPSVSAGDDFRAVPMWSSMVGFAVMVMIDLEYGRPVAAADIQAARTVADLAKLAGVAVS